MYWALSSNGPFGFTNNIEYINEAISIFREGLNLPDAELLDLSYHSLKSFRSVSTYAAPEKTLMKSCNYTKWPSMTEASRSLTGSVFHVNGRKLHESMVTPPPQPHITTLSH